MNPTTDVDEHVLAIDERQTRPDLDTAIGTADLYRLVRSDAERIVADVRAVLASWEDRARALGLPRAEIAIMAPAFALVTMRG